jgi:hypothetical protein
LDPPSGRGIIGQQGSALKRRRVLVKRGLFALCALSLTFVLSSCFSLQGFTLLTGAIDAGAKTKARFTLRPFSEENERNYQFVIVGVPDTGGLTVGAATWDAKGAFDGPYKLAPAGSLPAVLAADGGCGSNGIEFSEITDITWKAFLTPTKVRSKGMPSTSLLVEAIVRAAPSATTGTNYAVFGVTGVWDDNGNSTLETADTFACFGISSAQLWVNGAPV